MKKRILSTLCLTVFFALSLAAVQTVFAAGTVSVSVYNKAADGSAITVKLSCVGDASDGSVPATDIPATITQAVTGISYTDAGYYLTGVSVVDAGTTDPDAADIAITDALGQTLYSEANVIPTSGTNYGTLTAYYLITSVLTVTVTNQATHSAVYAIYLTFAK